MDQKAGSHRPYSFAIPSILEETRRNTNMGKSQRNLALNIVSIKENRDLEFWLSKSAEERISAVEFLRMQHYCFLGYKSIPRIVPVIHIRGRRL